MVCVSVTFGGEYGNTFRCLLSNLKFWIMKVLNPYSVELGRENPFYEVEGKPIYKNGNFSVYNYANVHNWFVYLYKNIVITERTGASKELVDRFANNDEPADYSKYNFRRALKALKDGKKYARKLGFKVR